MRKALIAANWKCHGSLMMVDEYAAVLEHSPNAEIAVFPPAVFLAQYASKAANRSDCGIQDLGVAGSGAHTGEIAGDMVRAVGGRWVIVGHSERRHDQMESDDLVAEKLNAAMHAGLRPILCIGETEQQRDAGNALAVVEHQLRVALARINVAQIHTGAIAYEPIWAIGTGRTATPRQAQDMHVGIRAVLRSLDVDAALATRIIYGGSVNADNASALFSQADIDGALVGGASLQLDTFTRIIAAVA
jgi:triosephosphate isomerase